MCPSSDELHDEIEDGSVAANITTSAFPKETFLFFKCFNICKPIYYQRQMIIKSLILCQNIYLIPATALKLWVIVKLTKFPNIRIDLSVYIPPKITAKIISTIGIFEIFEMFQIKSPVLPPHSVYSLAGHPSSKQPSGVVSTR